MSDAAITNDCLHHYDNRHIQVRWDFFSLCAYDKSQFNCRLNGKGKIIKDEPNQECAAKILRVLETLTNHEKLEWYLSAKKLKEQGLTPPPEPKEFTIQLSYGGICDLLYNTYGESTVRNTVAFLIQRNFIKQYQQTKNSIPFYVLRTDVIQKALKARAEKSLSGVEINSQSGESFQVLKSTARRPKSTAKPLKSKGGSVEINNNNNSKNNENQKEGKNESFPIISENPNALPSLVPSSTLSLSEKSARAAQLIEEARRLEEEIQQQAASESSSQVEHLSTKISTPVDNKQAVIQVDTSHIATATTPIQVPNVRRTNELNPANLLGMLSDDELRIHGYWLDLGYEADVTPTLKGHWGKLVRHIHNFEQMKDLYEFTFARLQLANAKDQTVYPGNLVKSVTGWKQKQATSRVAALIEKPKLKTKKQAEEEWVASLKADPWS